MIKTTLTAFPIKSIEMNISRNENPVIYNINLSDII
jgi:hypothetical protein